MVKKPQTRQQKPGQTTMITQGSHWWAHVYGFICIFFFFFFIRGLPHFGGQKIGYNTLVKVLYKVKQVSNYLHNYYNANSFLSITPWLVRPLSLTFICSMDI